MEVPRIEAAAWVATSFLTIVTDVPIAIAVGMLIGMFLYIRKSQRFEARLLRTGCTKPIQTGIVEKVS